MRIANNIMAMNTHRFYTSNNNAVSKAAEKLSSGYKINRAGDDAAGLAISEKMRAQIRGLNMAKKNSQDAVSMVQVAEGALQGVHSMLQRMNQLAVQAATGTNDIDLTKANGTQKGIDRAALQQEFENLQDEIDQVAQTTNFNQLYMLQGTGSAGGAGTTTLTAQMTVDASATATANNTVAAIADTDVNIDADAILAALGENGPAAGETLDITFADEGGGKVSLSANGTKLAEATITAAGDVTFADADGNTLATVAVAEEAGKTFAATDAAGQIAKLTASGTVEEAAAAAPAADAPADADTGKASFTVDLAGIGALADTKDAVLTIDGQTVTASNNTGAATADDAGTAALFDGATVTFGDTTYTASVQGTKVTFTAAEAGVQADGNKPADGTTATATNDGTAATLTDDSVAYTEGSDDAGTTPGAIPPGTYRIQVGAEEGTILDIHIDPMNTTSLGVAQGTVKIDTQTNASAAITATRNAINKVSTQRAELGAMQNRLEYKIDNLANTSENLSAAESRIRDVDIAEEMTNFTKNNILSQAATAMLAQANSLPQNVLSLLQ